MYQNMLQILNLADQYIIGRYEERIIRDLKFYSLAAAGHPGS